MLGGIGGRLLPVDHGLQGILGGQEGLRGQPPPVADRGTEVMRSAKSEPRGLAAHHWPQPRVDLPTPSLSHSWPLNAMLIYIAKGKGGPPAGRIKRIVMEQGGARGGHRGPPGAPL